MVKFNKRILVVFLVLAAVSLACGFSASTANIKEAYMASDENGSNRTTVFGQGDDFYCLVTLANAPDDTDLKAVWYAVEAENTDPNLMIDEYSITTGDGTIPFSLVNDSLWPLGKYKVEIFLNDALKQTIEFTVE